MSLGYTVSPAADRDLDSIADHLAENAGLEVALRFLEAADETFAILATQPEMGWKSPLKAVDLTSVRTFRVKGFEEILIFFRPANPGIEVLRVLHGAQDLSVIFEASNPRN